jgi:hypothetical protein
MGLDRLGLLLWMREQQAYRGNEAALADMFERALRQSAALLARNVGPIRLALVGCPAVRDQTGTSWARESA